ncbi:ArsR/SmtB family transcription factor [Actinomadura sp. 6N118]|uniref:ArsR/SmtB family transcription factor n=1 Tax=Actinomadura sp. 6N118 TaxID=3375151 RepID=UPI0037AE25B1
MQGRDGYLGHVTLARSRLLALTDPSRTRLCRLIARQAMTTADLAERLSMTRPQVSRHLRVLRELGLVRVERNGRYVHYGLDLAAVERIGRDVRPPCSTKDGSFRSFPDTGEYPERVSRAWWVGSEFLWHLTGARLESDTTVVVALATSAGDQ